MAEGAEWAEEREVTLTKGATERQGYELVEMVVTKVGDGTPAHRCGIEAGWRVLRVAGSPVGTAEDIGRLAAGATELRLQFARSSVEMDKPVAPAAAGLLVPAVRTRVAAELAEHPELDRWCTDRTVRRYIAGNVHNKPQDTAAVQVANASAQLLATLKWRVQTRPEQVRCRRCVAEPTSHNMRVVGTDRGGRAITLSCFAQATFRTDIDANVEHMIWAIEDSVRVMDASGRGAESWIWITDFHGYTMWTDGSPSSASRTGELLAHFPERLGRAVMVDAGMLFEATWAVVSKIINARTASKVAFIPLKDLRAELEAYCDEEMVTWLLREFADNRARKPAKPQKGRADGKRWWVPPAGADGHDARGTPSFVASLYRPPPWTPQQQGSQEQHADPTAA